MTGVVLLPFFNVFLVNGVQGLLYKGSGQWLTVECDAEYIGTNDLHTAFVFVTCEGAFNNVRAAEQACLRLDQPEMGDEVLTNGIQEDFRLGSQGSGFGVFGDACLPMALADRT